MSIRVGGNCVDASEYSKTQEPRASDSVADLHSENNIEPVESFAG